MVKKKKLTSSKDTSFDVNSEHQKDLSGKTPKTNSIISLAVFIFAISIVSISLVSVVFPALISSSMGNASNLEELFGLKQKINSFEFGVMATPLFASSVIILGLALLYFKKKLPRQLTKLFEKIFDFEISKKVTVITIIVILGIYIIFTVGELQKEEIWLDYQRVEDRLDVWSIDQAKNISEPHVRYFLLSASMTLFGNYGVIAFVGSVVLLLTTYLITKEIAKKRFAGIIAMLVVIQSNVFLTYDTSVTYDNFWILFYLLSLYTIIRAWPASPITYLLSIPSKALTAIFLPMSLFFIYSSDIQRKKKLILLASYGIIGIIGLIAISSFNESLSGIEIGESNIEFWQGFTSMAFQLRFDGLVVLLLMPLVIGLFIASRHGYRYANAVLVLIGFFILTVPILTGFTNMTNQPYRFVPLVVFFAMGIGVLLSKRTIVQYE